jgi:hypothetical protein
MCETVILSRLSKQHRDIHGSSNIRGCIAMKGGLEVVYESLLPLPKIFLKRNLPK